MSTEPLDYGQAGYPATDEAPISSVGKKSQTVRICVPPIKGAIATSVLGWQGLVPRARLPDEGEPAAHSADGVVIVQNFAGAAGQLRDGFSALWRQRHGGAQYQDRSSQQVLGVAAA